MVERLLIAMLADGHVLIEGVPGLAKTLTVSTWRRPCGAISSGSSSRRTCCRRPRRHYDLQPGRPVLQSEDGPIFANIILADEINRAPAKVQSALLEAMQERQVTLGTPPSSCRSPSWCSPRRIRSSRKGPTTSGGTGRPLHAQAPGQLPRREEERVILDRMTEGEPPSWRPDQPDDPQARKVVRTIYVTIRSRSMCST